MESSLSKAKFLLRKFIPLCPAFIIRLDFGPNQLQCKQHIGSCNATVAISNDVLIQVESGPLELVIELFLGLETLIGGEHGVCRDVDDIAPDASPTHPSLSYLALELFRGSGV